MGHRTIDIQFDDIEAAKGREIEAKNAVEIEVTGLGRVKLDLNDGNLGTLNDALKPYFSAGERITGTKATASAPKNSGARKSTGTRKASTGGTSSGAAVRRFNKAARDWAVEQGMEVSEKGRLANEVIDAYKAHNPNWEREFFVDSADDSAPAAPAQVPDEDSAGEPAPVPASGDIDGPDGRETQGLPEDPDDDDGHGWPEGERMSAPEPVGQGSYHS